MNFTSITVRLPHDLNTSLTNACKALGMPKTTLIRIIIHEDLQRRRNEIVFDVDASSGRDRLVLNVNEKTYAVLESVANQHNQSINAVVTVTCSLALERASKWLKALEQ